VPRDILRSSDGGQNWADFNGGLSGVALPFFVRLARDDAPGAVPQTFLTFSEAPAAFYVSTSGGAWKDASGTLHWQDSQSDTAGFATVSGVPISLRNLAAHPARAGVWGAVSNKFAYVTQDSGSHWLVSQQPRPAGSAGAIYLLSSIAFDPTVLDGFAYYLSSKAMNLVDGAGNLSPLPASFGHLFKTVDGGASWTSLGTQATGAGGLPFVPIDVIKVDPGDTATLYAGTELGLYRSIDGGTNWARFGAGSLPLVEVSDICTSPAGKRLVASTYGRGFWEISTDASAAPAGVRGDGDTNFDQRIDGEDLIDLADGFGATQASPTYRWQADLTGATNLIDADDLALLLARFGGRP
jgi:hypothetical protein